MGIQTWKPLVHSHEMLEVEAEVRVYQVKEEILKWSIAKEKEGKVAAVLEAEVKIGIHVHGREAKEVGGAKIAQSGAEVEVGVEAFKGAFYSIDFEHQ